MQHGREKKKKSRKNEVGYVVTMQERNGSYCKRSFHFRIIINMGVGVLALGDGRGLRAGPRNSASVSGQELHLGRSQSGRGFPS